MIRVSDRSVFWIFLCMVLAACQSGPGESILPSPPGGQTLTIGETPAATGPSLATPTGTPAPTETVSAAPTGTTGTAAGEATATPAQVRYVNDEIGYRVDVPAGSVIHSDQPELVRIDLPVASGTDLSDKYLEISVAGGQADCSSPYALGYDPAALQSQTVVYNGIEFLQQSGSEGAAGSIYEFTSYSTPKDELCLSLSFVLHSLNSGVFDTTPPQFDPLAEKAIFEGIAQSFVWTGE